MLSFRPGQVIALAVTAEALRDTPKGRAAVLRFADGSTARVSKGALEAPEAGPTVEGMRGQRVVDLLVDQRDDLDAMALQLSM